MFVAVTGPESSFSKPSSDLDGVVNLIDFMPPRRKNPALVRGCVVDLRVVSGHGDGTGDAI